MKTTRFFSKVEFSRRRKEVASVLIIAVCFIAVLTILVAAVLSSVSSRAIVSNQIAGWHQARLAAEAGVDFALANLKVNVPDPTSSSATWSGSANTIGLNWLAGSGTIASGAALGVTGTDVNPVTNLSGSSSAIYTGTSLAAGNMTAYVNISLQAFQPYSPGSTLPLWFKIRSMGTALVNGPARSGMEKWDSDLRRLSLWNVRDSLVALTGSIPGLYPAYWNTVPKQASVSRVIEVIARPYTFNPFGKFALFTQNRMDLGASNNYGIDSYNSGTSDGGLYPGASTRPTTWDTNAPLPSNYGTIAHWGANIGTNSTAIGAISTNGANVYGTAQTPIGNSGVNSAGDIKLGVTTQKPLPLQLPDPLVVDGWPAVPSNGRMGATPTGANNYFTATDPGALTFTGTGYVTVVINGDWNIGSGNGGNVIIPPSVYVTVYVGGNINFGNGMVNMGNGSSGIPTHLVIYGMAPPGYGAKATDASFDTSGKVNIAAAFYGPNYAVNMSGGGGGGFYGSIVADSFSISGAGGSSFHYDEALRNPLPNSKVSKYQVSSYFEDSRL